MNSAERKKNQFIRKLRQWYRKHQRSYPWRNTKNPYKILVSEFLLQKTNADLALTAYKSLVKDYPNPKFLANARIDKLKRLVSPIGLSYRAERLITTAKQLVYEFNGQVPGDRQNLLKLYGVGLYISSAVLCFAYNKRIAIIDTNTIRIFSRAFGIKSHLKRPRTDKNLERQVELFLPIKNVNEFNYALLDFGATICTAKHPKCAECPLNTLCNYYQESKKGIIAESNLPE
jgi:A/G-specific adenine glycosylase